jgi:hypothetical protein
MILVHLPFRRGLFSPNLSGVRPSNIRLAIECVEVLHDFEHAMVVNAVEVFCKLDLFTLLCNLVKTVPHLKIEQMKQTT